MELTHLKCYIPSTLHSGDPFLGNSMYWLVASRNSAKGRECVTIMRRNRRKLVDLCARFDRDSHGQLQGIARFAPCNTHHFCTRFYGTPTGRAKRIPLPRNEFAARSASKRTSKLAETRAPRSFAQNASYFDARKCRSARGTYVRSAASKMRLKRARFSANVCSASATSACGLA